MMGLPVDVYITATLPERSACDLCLLASLEGQEVNRLITDLSGQENKLCTHTPFTVEIKVSHVVGLSGKSLIEYVKLSGMYVKGL